jgi:hypothetical protein
MFELVFGSLILKTKMPNHEKIKEAFMPHLNDPEAFGKSDKWDCDCDTTIHHEDLNQKLPWHLFYENIQGVLGPYIQEIGLKQEFHNKIHSYAWANRYHKGQHQEIHAHSGDNNIISCAYMLDLPGENTVENSGKYGQFIFYDGGSEPFSPGNMHLFNEPERWTKRHNPFLEDGDIVMFPSTLEHYVTWNKSDTVRSSISANFRILED